MATMPNGMTTGGGEVQEHYGPMSIDAVLDAEVEAERAVREILLGLQLRTGRVVDWAKVEVRDGLRVTINTINR